ncbi:7tm Odorant receptor [Popillia japonica]|uniref:7tm Odorant receptor n=1 Tax=Popillia japonica TaxID=7064 RepID=A0AAW1JWM1_POPJA
MLSFPLFMQYAYGCFIICNTILQLTILGEKDSTTIIGLCGYSGIVFAQMSAYHWLGNEIICQSDKITESCSLSKWYNLNVKCQKYLIVLMERAKRQLTISLYGLVFVSLASLAVGDRDSSTMIGLCGYSGIVLAQMSAYHWLGNEIIFKSDRIIEACFLSEWYNLSLKCQRYLITLMERAKRPLCISLYDLVFVSFASLGVFRTQPSP